MKRKNSLSFIAACGISLLVAMLILQPVHAAEVWSDDFETINYDIWNVRYGSFSSENGTLAATTDNTPDGDSDTFDNAIWRESTVSNGTWSFDLYWGGTALWGPAIWFANEGLDHGALFAGGKGFCVQLEDWGGITWDFMYIDGDPDDPGWPGLTRDIARLDAPYGMNVWRHVVFTLEDKGPLGGVFRLYINGTSIGGATFDEKVESQYIFIAMNSGCEIDNLVVSDTIDPPETETTSTTTTPTPTPTPTTTTTPTPTETGIPTELLAAAIGIPVILVIVVVVWKVKK